jgi:hypothetical protein
MQLIYNTMNQTCKHENNINNIYHQHKLTIRKFSNIQNIEIVPLSIILNENPQIENRKLK